MIADPQRLGRVLATLREHRAMTQQELADRLGVHRNTVSRWERGTGVLPVVILGPLCAALRVRPEIFVDLPLRRLERYFVD